MSAGHRVTEAEIQATEDAKTRRSRLESSSYQSNELIQLRSRVEVLERMVRELNPGGEL